MSTNSVNGALRTRQVKRFGWVPDIPDARDFMFSAPESVLTALPKKVNLTSKMPPVYDQGQLGSCTANAIAWVPPRELRRVGVPSWGPIVSHDEGADG